MFMLQSLYTHELKHGCTVSLECSALQLPEEARLACGNYPQNLFVHDKINSAVYISQFAAFSFGIICRRVS